MIYIDAPDYNVSTNWIVPYLDDWNKLAYEIFQERLDSEQREILSTIQQHRRVTVRSGHGRGKDRIGAVAAMCFLYSYSPSKVVLTAPTDRQVRDIMMSECRGIYARANRWLADYGKSLGGEAYTMSIRFADEHDHFLLGFKAADDDTESWTGFHSPHIMVVISEASGFPQTAFNAVEGLLTGRVSKLLQVGNPNALQGEFYNSFRDKQYRKFVLNCLNAPNVKAKEILIPGQVDYEWVKEHIEKPGWCTKIKAKDAKPEAFFDFCFEGQWYRPGDLARPKILGQFPSQSEDVLIPLDWVERANQLWIDRTRNENDLRDYMKDNVLRLGVDIAGEGRDNTIFLHRYGNYVERISVSNSTSHMANAGRTRNILQKAHNINSGRKHYALIDAIGEGAGVVSRLKEQRDQAIAAKFSLKARGLSDVTGERKFTNLRAYCYFAVRDALDPQHDFGLALPPDDELLQELTEHKFTELSNGLIQIESKKDIKKRLKRSPDRSDALALSFYPERRIRSEAETDNEYGTFDGVGVL